METVVTALFLAFYLAILVLGVVAARLLLRGQVAARASLAAVIVFGVAVEVLCVLFLIRWWHLVPGVVTALRLGVPFVAADAMIVLTLLGRRASAADWSSRWLAGAFWCAVVAILGYAQLFLGSGY